MIFRDEQSSNLPAQRVARKSPRLAPLGSTYTLHMAGTLQLQHDPVAQSAFRARFRPPVTVPEYRSQVQRMH